MQKDKYPFHKKIVVIGGGTGTFTLLRGLTSLNQPDLITAIPGMWDNGGSTGRLRSELGALPVGDIRQCLIGLMEDEEQQLWAMRLSNDRFKDIVGPLQGQDLFNLIIDRLGTISGGLQNGIDAFRKLHKIRGHVAPVTLINIDLSSQFSKGPDLFGEEKLDDRWKEPDFDPNNKVEAIYLSTPAEANPKAVAAIKEADIIVFPPGSLYGSILPHFLIRGIKEAIKKSKAKLIYVSNLMTERGQTDTLNNASDYLKQFLFYLDGDKKIDYLIANHNGIEDEPLNFYIQKGHQTPVVIDKEECLKLVPHLKISTRNMVTYIKEQNLIRHDSSKLAEIVLDPDQFAVGD